LGTLGFVRTALAHFDQLRYLPDHNRPNMQLTLRTKCGQRTLVQRQALERVVDFVTLLFTVARQNARYGRGGVL
jgi:hypothetical protein